jgi:segregation and condensation protein B
MEISHLIPHIEALIFASEKPLTTLELTDVINHAFGFMEDKITLDQVESAVEGIIEKYRAEFYPFEVRESGGGWQFLTKRAFHKTVAQLNGDKFLKRLSTAALETLSIIAYKQPVTKGEIEVIRGVSSDYAIQKLLEKDLIVIIGRNEKLPGHPLVYATSKTFMDYFGINSAEDLPKLKEVFDESIIQPTIVNEEAAAKAEAEADTTAELTEPGVDEPGVEEPLEPTGATAETSQLLVREDGELIDESAALQEDAEEEQIEESSEAENRAIDEAIAEAEEQNEMDQEELEKLEEELDEMEEELEEAEEEGTDEDADEDDEEEDTDSKKPRPGDN